MKKINSFDKKIMNLAVKISKKSDDPHTKVGAIIIDEKNNIIGKGYNHYLKTIPKNKRTWNNKYSNLKEWINTKYPYVIHAELDALSSVPKNKSISNCKIYVTLFPCNECAKNLIHNGIKEIIYKDDIHHDQPAFIASRNMINLSKIKIKKYKVNS